LKKVEKNIKYFKNKLEEQRKDAKDKQEIIRLIDEKLKKLLSSRESYEILTYGHPRKIGWVLVYFYAK